MKFDMNANYSHCFIDCPYTKNCAQDNGRLEEYYQLDLFGDDFTAVEGSHFCRLSWQQFADDHPCFQKVIEEKVFNPI